MTGFDYFASLQPCNLYDWQVLCLAQMQKICASNMFQAFQLVGPTGKDKTVAAKGSYLASLSCKPGTIIYGIKAQYENIAGLEYTFKVYEDQARPIFDSFAGFNIGVNGWRRSATPLPFLLLNEPVPLLDGRITLEISNPNNVAIQPQVILICAEPVSSLADLAGKYC